MSPTQDGTAKSRTGWRCASSMSTSAPGRQPRRATQQASPNARSPYRSEVSAYADLVCPPAAVGDKLLERGEGRRRRHARCVRAPASRWRRRRDRALDPEGPSNQRSSSFQPARACSPSALLNKVKAERRRRSATRIWCRPSGSRASRAAPSFSTQCRTQAPRILWSASSTSMPSASSIGLALCQAAGAPVTNA